MKMGNSNLFHIIAIALVLMIAMLAGAKAAGLRVTEAWMRAMPSGVPSGGYFTLHNGGGRDAVLTGAQSPGCGMLMLHKSGGMAGMASMADVESVKVAAGASLAFAPGGYHMMCMDARLPHPGGSVPVTLIFGDGSRLTAKFAVRDAAGR